ncbi:DNA polymerase III subunit gamma/tau [Oceanisphaera avium]|uniref:DNA polymerase III subunit gamma/tau n=1 Tax=Oceanisphaera avium TaxID=1903694 RepID=UPI0012FB09FE|nr:DNA polymerase III subunit gamma/tau [Oceanisphaera avium]
MNYQVLARKWRPQRFNEVVGQQHVLSALVNALAQGRLHHAYLFSGTRGVGKTSIARLLAKALNCEQGITAEPCGTCSSCVEIEQGRFVDLLEIDAASRTKVEDTRELLDNVQYQPARGRFKVYLIDEVHMLSRHSFNALLKTLEEPPPHVKFLLATTDPQKLPITILSRCLQFHLKSLSAEQIKGQLQHILQQEQLPFEEQATAALARAADGSVRDALSLTDQALAFGNGQINLIDVEVMLGNLNHNQLMTLVNALLSGEGGVMLAQVAELASMGPDYDHILKEMVGFWHQLALAQIVAAPASLPFASELNRLAPLISAEQIQLYYQIFLQGRKDLPFAADGRAALEMTLLRALAFSPKSVTPAQQQGHSQPHSAHLTVKKPESQPAPRPLSASTRNEPLPALSLGQDEQAVAPQIEPALAPQIGDLYHEQETILAQAAKFGYQEYSDHATLPAKAELSTEKTTAEPITENTTEPELDAKSPAIEAAMSDEAADNVAQIRRLLQTRNRLRSQEVEPLASQPTRSSLAAAKEPLASKESSTNKGSLASEEPLANKESLASEEPLANKESSTNKGSLTTEQPLAAVPPLTQPQQNPLATEREFGQRQSAELVPLTAYDDISQAESDDAPPWLDDTTLAENIIVEPQGGVQKTVPVSSTVAVLKSADAGKNNPGAKSSALSSVQRPSTVSAAGEPEPLKASSLLAFATDKWARLVFELSLGGLLRQLAMHSSLEQMAEQQWRLWLKPAHKHLFNEESTRELKGLLNAHLQATISLEVQIGEQEHQRTPADIERELYLAAIAKAKDEIEADDAVQFLISRFAAQLDSDSIEPMNP